MACIEECNRIEGMRLLMANAKEKNVSMAELHDKIREWWQHKVGTAKKKPDAVVAYVLT
jgi:hypothetical protein